MIYLKVIIFALIQGATEFIPVSSTAHLVILHKFIDLPLKNNLAFDVVLHLATLLSIIYFFRSDILKICRSWFLSLFGRRDNYSALAWLIILATIPAALAGYVFEGMIENYFRSIYIIIAALLIVGWLFLLVEKLNWPVVELENLKYKNAFLIGLAQAAALIPGVSRSGITIIAGLASGLKREAAARFSFLLSAPIIFGAFIKKAPQIFGADLTGSESVLLIVAFLAAFISGVIAIKYFLNYVKNNSLKFFAYYRFGLAFFLIILLLVLT